jgi:single-stranded DNA-specific DHH superfamily exonuclease
MVYTLVHNTKIPRLTSFINAIRKEDPVIVLYDDDGDGICSAALLLSFFERFGIKNTTALSNASSNGLFSAQFVAQLKSQRIKHIFCLDFDPVSWGLIPKDQLVGFPFNLIVFDHHFDLTKTYDHCVSMMQRLFIHPQNCSNCDNASQYCTSKLVYDVCNGLLALQDREWVAVCGMISDMNHYTWSDYMIRVASRFDVHIDSSHKESWITNPLGELSAKLNLARSVSVPLFESALPILVDAQSVTQAVSQVPLQENAFTDWQKYVTQTDEFIQVDERTQIRLLKLESHYSLCSLVSTTVSFLQPHQTIFVYQYQPDGSCHFSGRTANPSKHLGQLFQKISAQFSGAHGGGHAPAAGAMCKQEDAQAFLQALLQAY